MEKIVCGTISQTTNQTRLLAPYVLALLGPYVVPKAEMWALGRSNFSHANYIGRLTTPLRPTPVIFGISIAIEK